MFVFSFKAQPLKLASIIGVCNSGCKAFFMFKYFFGSRLATFKSEWSLLRDNPSPSTILSTPFYSTYLKALTRNRREILSRQDQADLQFCAKKCYSGLLRPEEVFSSYSSPALGSTLMARFSF